MTPQQSSTVKRPLLTLKTSPKAPIPVPAPPNAPASAPAQADAPKLTRKQRHAAHLQRVAEAAERKAAKIAARQAKIEAKEKRLRKKANLANERREYIAAARSRIQAYHAGLATMKAIAPALFNERRPLPLKIGVTYEVHAVLGGSIKFTHKFLAWWTRKLPYQRAIAAGGPRYGLDGQPCGEISAEQQARTAETIPQAKAADLAYRKRVYAQQIDKLKKARKARKHAAEAEAAALVAEPAAAEATT